MYNFRNSVITNTNIDEKLDNNTIEHLSYTISREMIIMILKMRYSRNVEYIVKASVTRGK